MSTAPELNAAAEAILALWQKQGLDSSSSLAMAGAAIGGYRAYLAALTASPASHGVVKAATAVLASWDARMHGEREELRNYASNPYWSPRASMVDSEAIAALRAALAPALAEPQGVEKLIDTAVSAETKAALDAIDDNIRAAAVQASTTFFGAAAPEQETQGAPEGYRLVKIVRKERSPLVFDAAAPEQEKSNG